MRLPTFLRAHADVCRERDQLHKDCAALQLSAIQKDALIETLRSDLWRVRADLELVALCVPPERRREAVELVGDAHTIAALAEVEQ